MNGRALTHYQGQSFSGEAKQCSLLFSFFFKARTHKVIGKAVKENDQFIKCISLEAPA